MLHEVNLTRGADNVFQVILAPFTYIQSMPSKGVRDRLIDSLNIWLQVPEEPLQIIRNVVHLLHTSSLM